MLVCSNIRNKLSLVVIDKRVTILVVVTVVILKLNLYVTNATSKQLFKSLVRKVNRLTH